MRIRQIALVARELDPVVDDLCAVLGVEVAFNDPGVAEFGLKNAVMALGDQFLEVVSPFRADASAARYLERRRGDGGYMVILQSDDLDADRTRLARVGARIVWEIAFDDIATIHLHPRDVGGAIVSLDRPLPPAAWRWAGPGWEEKGRRSDARAILGAEIQSDEPAVLAARRASQGLDDEEAATVAVGAEGEERSVRREGRLAILAGVVARHVDRSAAVHALDEDVGVSRREPADERDLQPRGGDGGGAGVHGPVGDPLDAAPREERPVVGRFPPDGGPPTGDPREGEEGDARRGGRPPHRAARRCGLPLREGPFPEAGPARVEVPGQVDRRGVALLRPLLQAAIDDPQDGVGEAGDAFGKRRGLVAQDGREDLGRGCALERPDACEHLVEDDAQRELVGRRLDREAPGVLRGHVRGGSRWPARRDVRWVRRDVRPRLAVAERLGSDDEAEVEDLRQAVAGQEDVLGFQVAVDEAVHVRFGERVGDLRRDVERAAERQGAAHERRPESLAVEELGHGEGHAVDAAVVVDREDARMREGGDGLRLGLELGLGARVGRHALRQDLQGDVAVQLRVPRTVDDTHPTSRDRGQYHVRPELPTRGERQALPPRQRRTKSARCSRRGGSTFEDNLGPLSPRGQRRLGPTDGRSL